MIFFWCNNYGFGWLSLCSKLTQTNKMYFFYFLLSIVIGSAFINGSNAVASDTECKKYNTDCDGCIKNNCSYCDIKTTGYCMGPDEKNCSSPITNVTECVRNTSTETTASTTPITTTTTPPPPLTTPSTTTTTTTTVNPVTTTITTASTSSGSSTVTPTSSGATESSTESSHGRHFDAPSFIGGIVLSVGLLAIMYVGFKFYKARTERNYHTL